MNFADRSLYVVLRTGLLLLPALLPLVGCGRAAYEAHVDQAISRLKTANKFKTLDDAPTDLAAWKIDQAPTGTKVTFRKPTHFGGKALKEGSPDPRKPDEAIRLERLKPPFLQNFPGFSQAWEDIGLSNAGYNISYLYVGAQQADSSVADRVLEEIKTALPEQAALAWTNADVLNPDGSQTKWRMLNFTQVLSFWVPGSEQPITPGGATFVLLMREDQGRQVFLAGRWTEQANPGGQRMSDLLAAAGTVGVALNVKID